MPCACIAGEDAAEKGHTFRRTRLLWPPLLPMVKSGGAAVVKAIRGDAFLQLIATVFVVLCFPIWLPILMILALILVPMLVVDELLQVTFSWRLWLVDARQSCCQNRRPPFSEPSHIKFVLQPYSAILLSFPDPGSRTPLLTLCLAAARVHRARGQLEGDCTRRGGVLGGTFWRQSVVSNGAGDFTPVAPIRLPSNQACTEAPRRANQACKRHDQGRRDGSILCSKGYRAGPDGTLEVCENSNVRGVGGNQ